MTTSNPQEHWALLIGVNHYGGNGEDDLVGSVKDVAQVEEYLRKTLPRVKITKLTATTKVGPGPRGPAEDTKTLPSKKNVLDALDFITKHATAGHRVHIYFSGHGFRKENMTREEGTNRRRGYLGLTTYEFENPCTDVLYLYGFELAAKLSEMVREKLLVSVVLDCCFSGIIPDRSDTKMRTRCIKYDKRVEDLSDFEGAYRHDVSRDVRLGTEDWLINPKGYTILTACGPDEKAKERIAPGLEGGALTSYLLAALEETPGNLIGSELLVEHIFAGFQGAAIPQTPMLYGRRDLLILGAIDNFFHICSTSILIYEKDKTWILNAGQAHGVYEGEMYELSSLESNLHQLRGIEVGQPVLLAEARKVGPLTSTLFLNTESNERGLYPQTGWKAKPVVDSCLRRTSVLVPPEVDTTDWPEWLHPTSNAKESCEWIISVNGLAQFEILDAEKQKVKEAPTIPINRPDANRCLQDILKHLARLKGVQTFNNLSPNSNFEKTHSMVVKSANNGNTTDPNSKTLRASHGSILKFAFENKSSETLHLALFGLLSTGKIINLLLKRGGHHYTSVRPHSRKNHSLIMEIPQVILDRGETNCKDIFKVFVTSKPTLFPRIPLPDMPHSGPVPEDEPDNENKPDVMNDFLRNLGAGETDTTEDWVVHDFVIHTSTSS